MGTPALSTRCVARDGKFAQRHSSQVWYPSTVATLSRRARTILEAAYEKSAEGGREHPSVEHSLHDFGFRGCCTVEQAMMGGSAHLLNFRGTDTMIAAYYVQNVLNGGRPVGDSVPASEHRCAAQHSHRSMVGM